MCKCTIGDFNNGGNEITLNIPSNLKIHYNNSDRDLRQTVSVDSCMAEEIQYLWSQGIRTTGCCCGHNWMCGYIGVYFEDIPKMKALGYKPQRNLSRGLDCMDEDSFFPKKYYIYEDE